MGLYLKKKKGSTLVTVLVIMVVVSAMVFGMYIIFNNNDNAVETGSQIKELYFAAKSGVEIAEQALNSNDEEYFVLDDSGNKKLDKAGNPIKEVKPKMVHDFEENVLSAPLVDTIDKTKLTELSENLTITISIDYIDEAEADTLEKEDEDNGKTKSEIIRKENMFRIISTAANSNTNRTYVITKYLDFYTLNSYYE